MLRIITKILKVPYVVISDTELGYKKDTLKIVTPLENISYRHMSRSLAIREVDAGSTNAEEEELKALSNAYYDIERFGIHFVASPRHADMLLVTGPVTKHMAEALKLTYEAVPTPKVVVAVGDGAIDGGVFKLSPEIVGGVDRVIPVHFSIPGDPPSALTILCALREIQRILAKSDSDSPNMHI